MMLGVPSVDRRLSEEGEGAEDDRAAASLCRLWAPRVSSIGRTVESPSIRRVARMRCQASLSRPPEGAPASTVIALNVLAVGPLIIARRRPFSAAVAAILVTVAIVAAHCAQLTVAGFGVMLFLLAQLVTRRGLLVAGPLLVPFIVLATPRFDGGKSSLASTFPLFFLMAALVVAESMRKRGLAVAALDATQEAMAESIRARTVMEERARIARELHDIVAHHLSVIAVESAAARLTSPQLSSDAGGRLEAIASTAREALSETRRLLGVLRENTGGEADLTPQPGLSELNDLIDRARATGTHIRLMRQGEIFRLPLSIDLAAYRIVQEALTNARRYAPGRRRRRRGLLQRPSTPPAQRDGEDARQPRPAQTRASDRAQAVVAAYESGLVVPGA
jgi:signal transduction histidine kinase